MVLVRDSLCVCSAVAHLQWCVRWRVAHVADKLRCACSSELPGIDDEGRVEALRSLMALARLLVDADNAANLRVELLPCRCLALQALWSLQGGSCQVEHCLLTSLVGLADICC